MEEKREQVSMGKREQKTLDDEVIVMLRKCGHYLHHNAGRDSVLTSSDLLKALSDEEKATLLLLLKKCEWK